ncbi:MAG: hypothetical protein QME76_12450 [Bacillota bacterium]|nr:hypothetical protein [Bacillota bacterium]
MVDVVALVLDVLRADPGLADVAEWQPVNGLISLRAPGVSAGIEKEIYQPDTRDADTVTATVKIVAWTRAKDPAAGEAAVRDLAYAVRYALNERRTLNGQVDGLFVSAVEYLTADAGQGLLLHLAEITCEVDYTAGRVRPSAVETVGTVAHDVAPEA